MNVKSVLFNSIYKNKLVYNQCWEDPRCDRNLLDLTPESEVVMITSAGCNALDYLLDEPKKIYCIDVNYRQNALLELKKAIIENGHQEELVKFFREGHHTHADRFYWKSLRKSMPHFATRYWDKKIDYFMGGLIRPSFYFRGSSGLFAWFFYQAIQKNNQIKSNVQKMWTSATLEEQAEYWIKIKPSLFKLIKQAFNTSPMAMTLIGVPESQSNIVTSNSKNNIISYLENMLDHTFSKLSVKDNYFWYVYCFGKYSKNCQPNYLKEDNFELLNKNTYKIRSYTQSVTEFLKERPGQYTHFILLDHMDWMVKNEKEEIKKEWKQILKNSIPGTKILLRSAYEQIDFIPDFAKERLVFDDEKAKAEHLKDRVGTYASTLLATVI